jgi:hypothetical protein
MLANPAPMAVASPSFTVATDSLSLSHPPLVGYGAKIRHLYAYTHSSLANLAINGGGKIELGYTHLRCGVCDDRIEDNQNSSCVDLGLAAARIVGSQFFCVKFFESLRRFLGGFEALVDCSTIPGAVATHASIETPSPRGARSLPLQVPCQCRLVRFKFKRRCAAGR